MAGWTDEQKQEVIDAYVASNPTAETTTEIVKGLAEEHEKTSNGIRMVLNTAGVYVKQTEKNVVAKEGDKPKRASKADSIAELAAAIESAGKEVDDEIINKLTGKAAVYFTSLFS